MNVTNPASGKSTIFTDQYANIRWKISIDKELVSNVYIDGKLVKILAGGPEYVYPFNSDNSLLPGSHAVKIEVVDDAGKKISKEVSMEVLRR